MGPKYVFFDVDGTLVSHVGTSHIPGATRRAVALLRQNGHIPAIATARSSFLTRRVARELDIDLLVCCNGAHILNGTEVLSASWISDEALRLFRRAAPCCSDHPAAIDDRYVYTEDQDQEFRDYLNGQAGYSCIRPFTRLHRAFLLYAFSSGPWLPAVLETASQDLALERTSHFTEARPAGTSKWAGILTVVRRFDAAPGDVVVFGDGTNDVEMLRSASVGVAVGGAPDAVKAAADLVTNDIDEGGILRACIDLGLIDGPKDEGTPNFMGRNASCG